MATLVSDVATLIDLAKRLDPKSQTVAPDIAELLTQRNDLLLDMTWKEGNLPTGHRITMRTGYPESIWRRFNQGVPSTKSTTVQVDETCGSLYQRGKVDAKLANLGGNASAYRLSENVAHIDKMGQDMAYTLFYGDTITTPESFLGLSGRFSTISGAANGQNIIDGGGTQNDNLSIWLVCWGANSVTGIIPNGSKAGLQHKPIMDGSGDGCADALDEDGNPFRAYVDEYSWDAGIAMKDWRYVARLANVDVSNLRANSSAADLIEKMSLMTDVVYSMEGVKPVFYMNRTAFSILKLQALRKSNYALSIEDAISQFGNETVRRKELQFLGIPIRKCDVLTNTESRIT